MENDDRGVEVLDGGISTTSTAATHQMNKNNHNVNHITTAAQEDSTAMNGAINNTDRREENRQLGMQQGAGDDKDNEQQHGPFDEEEHVTSGAVPVSHVDSYHQEGQHADDVSSLQHTNMDDKSSYVHRTRYHHEPHEGAIDEEGEDVEYYEDDLEQQKALQRRNMLIIIMLVLFFVLVVAIGVGVGLAVKDNPVAGSTDEAKNEEEIDQSNTDDEYDGRGGGIDSDDLFNASSTPSSFPSNEGPCIPVEVGIIFDEYSGETGWMLVKGNYFPEDPSLNDIVWKSKYYKQLEYAQNADTFHKCFPQGYYTFVFTDKEADGICCNHGEGSYVLSSEGNVIGVGGEMDSEEETIPFELPFEHASVDMDGDGKDDRLGLIMPYDSSNMTEGVDCENFRLVILTDDYGIETTWELFEGKDKAGTLIANGGPYGSKYNYVVDYCLASPKEYVLYMYDWDRRGLCCNSGEGWYRISSGDIIIRDSDGQFGEVNVTHFVLPADGSVELASRAPTMVPVSRAPTGPPLLWTTLVPVGKKTAYPTEAPVTKFPTESPVAPPTTAFPTQSPVTPTSGPTKAPTGSAVVNN